MISVLIPTLNAEAVLPACLSAIVPAVVDGSVREVIVADGGSTDGTLQVADASGARIVTAPRGRGAQIAAAAGTSRMPWLLILHADSVLETGWEREAEQFIIRAEGSERRARDVAAFRFALDDEGMAPRFLEAMVQLRGGLLGMPYGDQGLLLPRRVYEAVGGMRPLPIMEDVDFLRRLGRRRVSILRSRAITSAERYRRDGYAARIARNQLCLAMYALGVPAERIARIYERGQATEARPAESRS